MRPLVRSPVIQITCSLALLAVCIAAVPKRDSLLRKNNEEDSYSDNRSPRILHQKKQLEDEINLGSAFNLELRNKRLPILPPIILLDFVNGTNDTIKDRSDEKSKRTIDDNLGYGFNNNNLFSGKHNYYFPAGKTGTVVSIEESISPFEPKTITEIVKPITEKPENEREEPKTQKTLFEALPDPLPLQNREPLPIYPPYPLFGQRTKLQKTTSDFDTSPLGKLYSNSYSTPGTPVSNTQKLKPYTSSKPIGRYTGLSDTSDLRNLNGDTKPVLSSYLASHMSGKYNSAINGNQKMSVDPNPTSSFSNNQEYNLSDYPKYTVENGIRYEHKIVWKYPDGRISETPPSSYTDSHSEYVEEHKESPATTGGFRPSFPISPRPSSQLHTRYNPYMSNLQNNIYSQKPVQFPNDQEKTNTDYENEPNKYVSSSNSGPSHSTEASLYTLATYKGQYGLRQNPKPYNYRPATSYNSQYSTYANHKPITKYPVNTANTEYTFNQENVQSENLFTANGQINKHVLSKYSPEAQQYLMKVFAGKNTFKNEYHGDESELYGNTDFSNLLNYNPSISQYIKNPSSILKAQPTFVQAGNSLIPVIILRVDGTPPLPARTGSNINLKSLLRQYLTQYANSVSKVTQNTNYELGTAVNNHEFSIHEPNPVEDLKHLTETLESLRQRGYQDPDFLVGEYPQNNLRKVYTQKQNNGVSRDRATSYSEQHREYHSTEREPEKAQKVKNIQIIQDPRYTSYKVDNRMGK